MARILVADDSADIRTLIVRILNRGAHLVTEAADGEQAFGLLLAEHFDLAVLDVMMPRLDGLTLCRMLRDTYGFGQLGILIVSAASSEAAALAAGADAFLSKPFLPSRLLAIVGSLGMPDSAHAAPDPKGVSRPRRRRAAPARSARRARKAPQPEDAHDECSSSRTLPADAAR